VLYSVVAANAVVSIAFAVRYAGAFVDAVDFGSTTLTLKTYRAAARRGTDFVRGRRAVVTL